MEMMETDGDTTTTTTTTTLSSPALHKSTRRSWPLEHLNSDLHAHPLHPLDPWRRHRRRCRRRRRSHHCRRFMVAVHLPHPLPLILSTPQCLSRQHILHCIPFQLEVIRPNRSSHRQRTGRGKLFTCLHVTSWLFIVLAHCRPALSNVLAVVILHPDGCDRDCSFRSTYIEGVHCRRSTFEKGSSFQLRVSTLQSSSISHPSSYKFLEQLKILSGYV